MKNIIVRNVWYHFCFPAQVQIQRVVTRMMKRIKSVIAIIISNVNSKWIQMFQNAHTWQLVVERIPSSLSNAFQISPPEPGPECEFVHVYQLFAQLYYQSNIDKTGNVVIIQLIPCKVMMKDEGVSELNEWSSNIQICQIFNSLNFLEIPQKHSIY